MATPTLTTDRLVLRPVAMADAPAIQKHFDNWNVVRHLLARVPWPYPEDGAEAFLRDVALPQAASGAAFHWAIVATEGPDEAIGMIEVRLKDDHAGNRGFWLAEPFWGRGYMTEAITAVQDFLFFELGIDRLVVMNARSNKASRRIKEKTGARFLGTMALEHRDGGSDAETWEVTRERWAALRGGGRP